MIDLLAAADDDDDDDMEQDGCSELCMWCYMCLCLAGFMSTSWQEIPAAPAILDLPEVHYLK